MPTALVLYDATGRSVPLARLSLSHRSQHPTGPVDGLGFIKSKGFKKFWSRYRKPIVGGALATAAVVGAAYTGGATLSAIPAILGKVAKGAGKVVEAVGGPETLLSAAAGAGGGGEGAAPPADPAAAPVAALAASPARAPALLAHSASSGFAGLPTPILIGGGVALLAVLMMLNQRSSTPQIIEVRRP